MQFKQMVGYNKIPSKNNLNIEADISYHNLTACIECYACLDGCPVKKNSLRLKIIIHTVGNPFLSKITAFIHRPLTQRKKKRNNR